MNSRVERDIRSGEAVKERPMAARTQGDQDLAPVRVTADVAETRRIQPTEMLKSQLNSHGRQGGADDQKHGYEVCFASHGIVSSRKVPVGQYS